MTDAHKEDQTGPRRQPAQQRSRERVERILAAASALIAEKGSDQVKMSEVAERAGISIASLYQYFPDKSAVIRTLAERMNAECRQCIAVPLAEVSDLRALLAAFARLFDEYYALFLAEPVMRDIRNAMQTDMSLMALELAESRVCGAMLADAMRRACPANIAGDLDTTAFLIWQLGEATMRLAISTSRAEGDAIVAAFKQMTLHEIAWVCGGVRDMSESGQS